MKIPLVFDLRMVDRISPSEWLIHIVGGVTGFYPPNPGAILLFRLILSTLLTVLRTLNRKRLRAEEGGRGS
jgi:hypothetical protein